MYRAHRAPHIVRRPSPVVWYRVRKTMCISAEAGGTPVNASHLAFHANCCAICHGV